MKNKETNEQMYMGLMAFKERNPKRYFFIRLMEKYDLIVTAYKKNNRNLVCERVNELSDWMRSRANDYGITAPEVMQYFKTNNLTLNFQL